MPRYEPAEELAMHLTGVTLTEDGDYDYDAIEDALQDKYDCGFEVFENIANDLLKMTMPVESPFGDYYHAFLVHDDSAPGVWEALMRTEANVVKKETATQRE